MLFCLLSALVTYQDKGVGFPVGRSNLVSKPGRDCFGGFDAEFGHGLRNVFDPIQQPLGSIVVVFQKTIGLRQRRKMKMNKLASTVSVKTVRSLSKSIGS